MLYFLKILNFCVSKFESHFYKFWVENADLDPFFRH
jgi:hypothetical protein